MNTQELRVKTTEELKAELLATLREQFNLRMQVGVSGSATKSSFLLKKTRKTIARIKTILNEKGFKV
jgi:large subunit ribosomal protein L29